jgi:hypothetical protein
LYNVPSMSSAVFVESLAEDDTLKYIESDPDARKSCKTKRCEVYSFRSSYTGKTHVDIEVFVSINSFFVAENLERSE